jgi:hypothetical protein
MADNKVRELKVGQVWNGREYVPMIRLKELWLKRAGFSVGDRVLVEVGASELKIIKLPF